MRVVMGPLLVNINSSLTASPRSLYGLNNWQSKRKCSSLAQKHHLVQDPLGALYMWTGVASPSKLLRFNCKYHELSGVLFLGLYYKGNMSIDTQLIWKVEGLTIVMHNIWLGTYGGILWEHTETHFCQWLEWNRGTIYRWQWYPLCSRNRKRSGYK